MQDALDSFYHKKILNNWQFYLYKIKNEDLCVIANEIISYAFIYREDNQFKNEKVIITCKDNYWVIQVIKDKFIDDSVFAFQDKYLSQAKSYFEQALQLSCFC